MLRNNKISKISLSRLRSEEVQTLDAGDARSGNRPFASWFVIVNVKT